MARKKTPPGRAEERLQLAGRLRAMRVELYGDRGGPDIAERLGIPARSWYNYEIGVTVPAEVVLRFLELTGVAPRWLLTGEGPKFQIPLAVVEPSAEGPAVDAGSTAMESLLRRAVRLLKRGEIRITWKSDD
jgi:hypothetical protein